MLVSGCALRAPVPAQPEMINAVVGKVVATRSGHPGQVVYLERLQSIRDEAGKLRPSNLHSLALLLKDRAGITHAGDERRLKNDTPLVHQLFSRSRGNEFELPPSKPGTEVETPAFRPGKIRIYCALHSEEDATLFAVPSGWAALVEVDGTFRIDGVEPGSYRVVAWGDGATRSEAHIRVSRGATVYIDLPLGDAPVPGGS